jgi:hypothetical protein
MDLGRYVVIRTGLVLSRKEALPGVCFYKYRALSLKNLTEEGQVILAEIADYYTESPLKEEYFTHIGDVLLRLSAPYTSTVITEKEAGLLVPSHFAIIRTNKKVDPYYLNWWLENSRKIFYKFASGGTMMGTISSGYVAEMQFEPPPLEIQKKIGELLKLAKREWQLLSSLRAKKKLLIDMTLDTLTKISKEK